MSPRPLEAVVEAGSEVSRISLSGQVDRDADHRLASAWTDAVALGARTVELDFRDVDYINSTGIALIVRILADARRDRIVLRASGLSEHYREIFRITRLADFMTLVDDAAPVAAEGGRR